MKKGRRPASKMREAASLALASGAGTDRSHQQHLREVTSTLQRICVGGCSRGPRSETTSSLPPEPHQLFSERYMQQRYSSTSASGSRHHPALVAMEREISSSCGAKEMQRVGKNGNSSFGQQSLPSGLRAHSWHSRGKSQQSSSGKLSPRQPLLEKRHRINSTPALVLSATKLKAKINSAPPVPFRSSSYNSGHIPVTSHALPKVKKDRYFSADVFREKTSADSSRIVHSQDRSRLRKSVSFDHHGIHSSASKKRLCSCVPSRSSGCGYGDSDRSFDTDGCGFNGGRQIGAGGEERESFMLEGQ